MANERELKFILRMRDEASKALRAAGYEVEGLGDQSEKATTKLDKMVEAAKMAAGAIAGIGASTKAIEATSGAWNKYELGIIGVVKTTNFASKELDNFRKGFDSLDKRMAGIDTTQLLGIAEAAGQMGVSGVNNILAFTEVVGKLGVTTDIAGEEAAGAIARILNLTGEGASAVKDFGDALNYLGNNSVSTESEILAMSSRIAQTTAEFQIGSKQILAFSAAAKDLGAPIELTGSALGRVLRTLRDGSATASQGFQDFLRVAGMTKEEFDGLLKQHPEQVLIRFGKAYGSLTKSGKSAGFLEKLGLNTDEIKQVFGVLSQNTELFEKDLEAISNGDYVGALDKEANAFFGAQGNQLELLGKRWERLSAAIGEAMAPLTGAVLAGLIASLNTAIDLFTSMPKPIQTVVAAVLVLTPAVLGAVAAVRLLATAFSLLGVGSSLAALVVWARNLAAGVIFLTASFGGLSGILATIGTALVAVLTSPITLTLALVAAVAAAGVAIYAYWDKIVEFFSQSWSDIGKQIYEALTTAFDDSITYMRQQWQDFVAWLKQGAGNGSVGQSLPFNPNAREDMKKKNQIGQPAVDNAAEQLDLLKDTIQKIKDQTAEANAFTAAQKQQLEIQIAIREAVKETGANLEEATRRITSEMTALNNARKNAAVFQTNRDLNSQIDSARARTMEQKTQVEAMQKINELERQYGSLSEASKQGIKDKISLLNQIQEAERVLQQYDPVGAAQRRYEEENRVLTVLREQNKLTAEQYDTLKKNLDIQSEQSRNPIGYRIKELRQELDVAKLSTQQGEIEKSVMQEVNGFRQQGITLTKEQTQAIRDYTAAMAQVEKYKSNGFGGFINEVGTVEDQLLTIQKNFADGLSDAITDALTGSEDSFADFAKNFGKQLISMAVKQGMANLLKGFGAEDPQKAALSRADAALAKLDALSSAGINTSQAIVNAGSVAINGTNLGNLPGTTGLPGAPVTPVTRANLAPAVSLANRGGLIDQKIVDSAVKAVAASGSYEQMLRASAIKYGVDPNTAVRVANSEGGLTSWQASQIPGRIPGTTEPSYGPMQMLIGGPGTGYGKGMGNAALAAGIDPRVPSQAYFDFAMKNASQSGWGSWYGAAKAGVGNWDGINRNGGGMQGAGMQQAQTALQAIDTQFGQVGTTMQNAASSAQTVAPAMQSVGSSTLAAGTNAQQSSPQFQQAGQAIQQAGQQAAQGGQAAQSATPSLGGFNTGVAQTGQASTAAIPGLGGFVSGIGNLLQQLLGGLGGGAGSIFSSIFSFLGFADGGKIAGPGTGRSDSIVARVSNGEFIVNAKATKQYEPLLRAINDNKPLKAFADGGMVNDRNLHNIEVGQNAMRTNAANQNGPGRGQTSVNNVFSPTIPITVQASGNEQTDKKMQQRLSTEMNTLLENKMAEFTQKQQRPGNMLAKRKFT